MPKILINERDYTSSGTPGNYANYAVLIAGYQKEFTDAEIAAANTSIAAYETAVKAKETDKTVVIPTLDDAAKMIKARSERIDSNGVYEFTAKEDFKAIIGSVEIEKQSEHDADRKEKHYGHKMAYELLDMGYTVIYKPIKYVSEMNSADFWAVFKDKASYDFRFISHGLLETNHNVAAYNALTARLAEIRADVTKFNVILDAGEALAKAKSNYETMSEPEKAALVAAACAFEYARVTGNPGTTVSSDDYDEDEGTGFAGTGEGYTGFKDTNGTRYTYAQAYSAFTTLDDKGKTLAEVNQQKLIEAHDASCITSTIFNKINGNIAELASYRDGAGRGDCIALIELYEGAYVKAASSVRPEKLIIEGIQEMSSDIGDDGADCALTVPSVYYKGSAGKMPGAFHYLACFMSSLKAGFAEWYAAAGYTRGVSSYIIDHTSVKLGEIAINALEPRYIEDQSAQPPFACNVIANFRGSYYLWGNRTAHKLKEENGGGDLVAQHFLNIRQLCTTIKKQLYVACRRFTFDPNSDTLWFNFVNAITPILDLMKSDQGIRDYKILKVYTDKKATLKAKIRIIPIEAVEDFDLEISLEDSFGETSAVVTE